MKKSRLMALFLSSIMLFNTVGSTFAYAEGVESIPDTSGVLESTLEEQSNEESGTDVSSENPSEGVENSTINLESGTNDGSEALDTGTDSGEHVFDLESLEHYSREPFSEYPEEYFDSLKEYIKSDEFSYPAFAEMLRDSGYFYGILAELNSEVRDEFYAKLSSSEIYALRGLALYEYLIELSYTKSADVKEETVDMYYDYSIIFSEILKVFESKKEEIGAISNFDKAEIDKGNYQLLTSHLLEEDSSQLLTHESFIAYLGVINPLDYNKLYTEICKIDVSTEDKLVDSLKGYKEFLYATYGFDVPQESESVAESVVESESESESETEKASESKELYSESTETEGEVESEASTEPQVDESKTVEEALEELPTVEEVLAISGDKEVTSEAIEEVVGGDTGFLFIEDLEALAEAGYNVSEYLEEPEPSKEDLANAAASKLASSDSLSFLSSAKNVSMYSSVPSSGVTSTGSTGTYSHDTFTATDDSAKVYLDGTNSYFKGSAESLIYNVKKYITYKGTKYDAFCIHPILNGPSTTSYNVYYISNDNMLKALYYGYGGPGFGNNTCNLKTLFDNYITNHTSETMMSNYNRFGRMDVIYATLTARLLAYIGRANAGKSNEDTSWSARLSQGAADLIAKDCYNKINSAQATSTIRTYNVHKVYSGASNVQDLVFLGPVCRSQLIINPNGGTWNSSTSNSTFTDYIGNQKTIANPTKSGYTFGGWTVSGGGTLSGTKFTYGSTSTTLTAKWNSSTYTVTYNANGGSGAPSAQTKTAGKALTLSSTKPTRSGCRFLGWGTSSTATTVAYAPGASYTKDANITLYAIWRGIYTVKYNGNGSTGGSMSNDTFDMNVSTNLKANAYSKTGHTFKNWNTNSGGTGTSYSDKASVKNLATSSGGTVTLYAQWTPITYSVKYNANGGSGTMSNSSHTYGVAKALTANSFTKSGYTFKGWSTSSSSTTVTYTDKQSVTNLSSTSGATVNLYAVWEQNKTYTVKYNSNKPSTASGTISGSTASSTHTVGVAKNLTSNGFSLTGWTFKNWNTVAGGTGTSYSNGASVKDLSTTNGATVNLYAQWTANTYSVKYNANGGSGTMSNSSHTYDTAKTLTKNTFTKSGYNFKGWSTSSTSTTVTYTDQQSVKNLTSTNGGTVNLYAVWEQVKTYTVKYNSNKPSTASGTISGSTASSTHTVGVAKNLTSNGFSLTGWSFKNWNTVAGGTGTSYSNGASVKDLSTTNGATVNLYAQWTANTYSVKYNANGGTGTMSNSTHTYDTAKTLTKNTFTRSGYNFKGWSTSSTSTTVTYTDQQSVKNLTSTNGGTVNLYAVWEQIKTYTVKYNSNKPSTASGTVSGSTASSTHTVGVAKNLTTNGFSLTGWTFKNWNTVAGGTGTSYSNGQSVTDLSTTNGATVNLYAQWTANTYTVKYNSNGGSGSMTSSTHTYDTAKTLTKNTFTRTGYTFKGWSTSNTATTATYTDQQSVKNLASTNGATVNLYAVWEIVSTTLTVNPNGGTWNSSTSNQTFTQNYNTTKTIANPTRTGYTFGGWTHSGGGSLSGTTFTFGTSNATLTAKWTGNPVSYTVKHYKQNLGASTYTLAETENKTGTAGTSVTPAVKSYTGFTAPSTQTVTIKGDGTTLVEYKYTRNSYTVTLNKGTGVSSVTGAGTYQYGASVTINATMSSGYSWSKWSGTHSTTTQKYTFTMPASNVTDTANASLITYTISYNLDGGTVATANPTSYNVTTATFTLNNPTKVGYTFTGWTGSNGSTPQKTVTIAKGSTGNKSYTANWTVNSYTNSIGHWAWGFKNSEGNNSDKTAYKIGTTTFAQNYNSVFTLDSSRKVEIPNGFSLSNTCWVMNDSGTYESSKLGTEITQKPSSMYFQYDYRPINYAITYTYNGGSSSVANPSTYNVLYGVEFDTPTRAGYAFDGWYDGTTRVTGINVGCNATFTSASDLYSKLATRTTGNKTIVAKWTPVNSAYTVKHYKQNLDGTTYTLADTENLSALTGTSVTPAVKSYTGFTAPSTQTVTIKGDGTTLVEYKYTRNSYTVTLNKGTGVASVSGAGTYKYGASVTIDAAMSAGYSWSKWSGTHSTTTQKYTFTMPASNVTDTANASLITYTIIYDLKGGTVATANPTSYNVTTETFTLNNPTRLGYTFIGWTGSNGGMPQKTVTITKGSTGSRSYTADWTANVYSVVYNSNKPSSASSNVSGTMANSSHTYDVAKNLTTNAYTLKGWRFNGWNTEPDGSGKSYSNGASVKNLTSINGGTVTLYAQWVANTYTVTYNGNGNTGGSTANSSHVYDVSKALTTNGFTKTGYTFSGWNTAANGSGTPYPDKASVVNLTDVHEGTVTLYAQWTINSYTLTVNPNGGTWNGSTSSKTFTQNYNTTKTIADPTRVGYRFGSWTLSGAGSFNTTNKVFTYGAGNSSLTAQWNANTYTVVYDKNKPSNASGTVAGTMANSSHTYDVAKTLTTNSYSLVGWEFTGWNTKADGSGDPYDNGASVKNLTSAHGGTVTLYAQWRAHTYTVVYNSNKPSGASATIGGTTANSYHTYDVAKNLTTNGYTLTGWTFTGWNTAADGSGDPYGNGASVKNLTTADGGTVTLYAQWKANTYTVVYNSNKPSTASSAVAGTMSNSSHTYDIAKNLNTNTYTLKGWTFAGWNTAADGSGKPYANSASVKNLIATNGGTVTLYAQWTANTYTVVYNSNKPSTASASISGTTASSTHTYDVAKKLTTNGYTLTGWTFTGWNTKADGSGNSYDNGASVSNLVSSNNGSITLYAQWTANTYTVVYDKNKPATASGTVAGTTASSSHTYDVAKNLTTNGYTLTGWTFTGWNTKADGSGKAYSNGASVSNLVSSRNGSITLYAQWSANTYTVTYDSNKPSTASATITGTMANSSHTYDVAKNLTANAYKLTGWTFTGWNTKADGSGDAYNNSQSVVNLVSADNGSITLYAQWRANTYTVVYSKNKPVTASSNVTGTMPNTVHTYDSPAFSITGAYKLTGWTFTGWNTKADGSGTSIAGSFRNLTSIDGGTVTLYAQWRANTYTVTYNSNKPSTTGTLSGSTANSSHTYDVAKNLTTNGYSLVGYTFKNWNTKADGSGTAYSNGASVKNLTPTNRATVTLYAQWTPNPNTKYTVKHYKMDLDGINYTLADTDNLTGTTDTSVTPAVKTYTGFTSPSTQTVNVDPDGSRVVEYRYTRNKYYIDLNYTLDGVAGKIDGVSSNSGPYSYTITVNGTTKTGKGDHYAQYYYGSPYSVTITPDPGYSTTQTTWSGTLGASNMGITVPLKTIIYTITYNLNGGTLDNPVTSYHVRTPDITLPEPVKLGYTFLGWYKSPSFSGSPVTTIPKGSIGNVTLYAKWQVNEYTMIFNENAALGLGTENLYKHMYDTGYYGLFNQTTKGLTLKSDSSVPGGRYFERTFQANQHNNSSSSTFGFYYNTPSDERLTVGETYTWSVYMKADSEVTINAGAEQGGRTAITVGTEWKRVTHTFTATNSSADAFTFYFTDGGIGSGEKLYFHSLEMHKGSQAHISSFIKNYDTTLGTLPTPTRDGYQFLGWYTDPVGGTQITEDTMVPLGGAEYYAHWVSVPELDIKFNYYFKDTDYTIDDVKVNAKATDAEYGDISDDVVVTKITSPSGTVVDNPTEFTPTELGTFEVEYSVTNEDSITTTDTGVVYSVNNGSQIGDSSTVLRTYNRYISGFALGTLDTNSIWRSSAYRAIIDASLSNTTPLSGFDTVNSEEFISSVR